MYTGKQLGQALDDAMKSKGVTQQEVATEFGIKQPSVSEWIRFGRIGKKHLTHLVQWFGEVGPEHWGLPPGWTSAAAATVAEAPEWPFDRVSQARWKACSEADRGYVQAAINKALEECEAMRKPKRSRRAA